MVKMDRLYTRNPEIDEREVDEAFFLVAPGGKAVHHLNATGSALWRLMTEPTSAAQAVDMLHHAFPDVARERIEADVAQVVADLAKKGFIVHS